MSGSRVANPKSGPDYSMFIMKHYLSFHIYIPCKMFSHTPWVRVPRVVAHLTSQSSTELHIIMAMAAIFRFTFYPSSPCPFLYVRNDARELCILFSQL
jgi:hypothetical protein